MNQKILVGIIAVIVLVAGAVAVFHYHKAAAAAAQDSQETNVPVNQLLAQAAKDEAQGDKLKAKEAYDQIISNYPDYDKIQQVQDKLGELNIDLIFSPATMPQTITYEIVPGDSLGKLARRYNTTAR